MQYSCQLKRIKTLRNLNSAVLIHLRSSHTYANLDCLSVQYNFNISRVKYHRLSLVAAFHTVEEGPQTKKM